MTRGDSPVILETRLAAFGGARGAAVGAFDDRVNPLEGNLIEWGQWLALVTGSLGKLGQDVALMAQSEVGEVSESNEPGRGGSSTLPQKANPVVADILMSIARQMAMHGGAMHQAALAEQERGASAWQLEWLNLPQMAELAGAALRHAVSLLAGLVVDVERMKSNAVDGNGLFLAEAATFSLAIHMPRNEARALVTEAIRQSRARDTPFIDCLTALTPLPLDPALFDLTRQVGHAVALVDRVLTEA